MKRPLAISLALLTAIFGSAPAALAGDHDPDTRRHCPGVHAVRVPGAAHQEVACLTDLTTAGTSVTGHTDPADYAGLAAPGTVNPTGIPGIQVDGYFPDSSHFNTHHGWNHDSQFVLRIPDRWNGGLVVTGAPGTRTQYANDQVIGDTVLAQGYAFASTDKGNSGLTFYQDGKRPGDAIAEWNLRVTQLTVAAKWTLRRHFRASVRRTYLWGLSNGGYLTRWQLENRPWLYDGGVDVEGTLFTPEHNLLTYLPTALRNYPAYAATGDPTAHAAMIRAGFAPGSEFLWAFHHQVYWDLTQRIYREEFDPTYDGALEAGIPYCTSGTSGCDADYDLNNRPASVKRAIAKVALTGRIGRPLITLHGTLDSLLPISTDSDLYDRMIDRAGRGGLHRYYRVTDANHVDGLYALFPDKVRPLVPCGRTAFGALVAWTAPRGVRPPADATLPRPTGGDPVNNCSLG